MNNPTAMQTNPHVTGRYTDDERGYVLDTLDKPLVDVAAALNRTEGAKSWR